MTIASYPNETAILSPTSGTFIVGLGDATIKYIIFDRLVLDGSRLTGGTYDGTSHNWGVSILMGAHHIRFQNGEIRNVDGVNVAIYGGDNGAPYPAYLEILNSKIHGATSHAFYIQSANNLVAGNDIYDNGGYAIQFYNGYTRSGVDNNEVYSNRIYNNDRVRQWGGAITLGHGSNRRVYNNLIYENNGGIELGNGVRTIRCTTTRSTTIRIRRVSPSQPVAAQ